MKKILSVLLSLVMLLSITVGYNTTAFSSMIFGFDRDKEYRSGDFKYVLEYNNESSKKRAEIIGYTGKDKNLKIPSSINGYKVIVASLNDSDIETISVPKSIESFSEHSYSGALRGCLNLKSISVDKDNNGGYYSKSGVLFQTHKFYTDGKTLARYPVGNIEREYSIPNGIQSIGVAAFEDAVNLKEINFPDSVENISYLAFCDSGIESVTIPKKVVDLTYDSFFRCSSLKSVSIPKSLKSIQGSFRGCKNIQDIYFEGTKSEWKKLNIWDDSSFSTAKVHYNALLDAKITLSKSSYTYDGKDKKPSVTVKDSNGKKISSKYYTVKYSSNKKAGTATVTVKFKGKYSGVVKKDFIIKPKSASISKLTAGKKKFKVEWNKQATQTTGYEIQYSTDKKFKKNNKTITIKNNKTTSKSISKLKAKKKYYVRIRTYKIVNDTKIYSSWSKSKTVTTK